MGTLSSRLRVIEGKARERRRYVLAILWPWDMDLVTVIGASDYPLEGPPSMLVPLQRERPDWDLHYWDWRDREVPGGQATQPS